MNLVKSAHPSRLRSDCTLFVKASLTSPHSPATADHALLWVITDPYSSLCFCLFLTAMFLLALLTTLRTGYLLPFVFPVSKTYYLEYTQ